MHTISQTLIILSLFAAHWCDPNSETEKYNEIRQERTTRPSYSTSNVLSRSSSSSSLNEATTATAHTSAYAYYDGGIGENCNEDIACLTLASQDRIGLEAIKSLHRQLDDDANGNVDLSESDEFLREELKYEEGYERRQKAFHRNDDMHISVRELWEAWIRSEEILAWYKELQAPAERSFSSGAHARKIAAPAIAAADHSVWVWPASAQRGGPQPNSNSMHTSPKIK